MAELMVTLVTVLGGVPAADGGSRRRCCGFFFFLMQRPLFFLSPRYLLFLSSVSPLLFPFLSRKPFCFSLSVSPFFLKNDRTLSLGLPFFFLPFFSFPPLSLLHSGGIYRGRGSGVDPAPSHRRLCMGCTSPALPRRRQRWPMEASLAGHGCSGISS